jgi:hypothetical protein
MICLKSKINNLYFKEISNGGTKIYLSTIDHTDIRYGDLPTFFTEDFDIELIESQLKGHKINEIECINVCIEIN